MSFAFTYQVYWIHLPRSVKENLYRETDLDTSNSDSKLTVELKKYHAYYDEGLLKFPSEEYYTWFLLRWS